MKLILQVLCPVPYELLPPDQMENLVYLPHPDPIPGSEGLWESKKDNGLWRTSKCFGINFANILKEAGYEIESYSRECTYTMSDGAISVVVKDIKENYPEITLLGKVPEDIKVKSLFSKDEHNVYEFMEKDGKGSILIINPEPTEIEAQVLPCIPMPALEVEVPSQAAVDYYISSGLYVYTKEGFQEISSGLPELSEAIEKLDPNYHIIRWEGVVHDESTERQRPWRDKLESLRGKMLKIANNKSCGFLKEKKIRKLIKNYYGNF